MTVASPCREAAQTGHGQTEVNAGSRVGKEQSEFFTESLILAQDERWRRA